MSDAAALLSALDTLAELVANKVVKRLRAGEVPDMVDQVKSPLGRRRHIKAVRRLVAAGEPGAAIVGRRYLLSRARLEAELGALGAASPVVDDELAPLRERFAKQGRAA